MIFTALNKLIRNKYINYNQNIQEQVEEILNKPTHIENFPNLIKLQEKLKLNDFELKIIIIVFAPEIYSNYNKIYAYLQDDLNKPYPTIEFIIHLLSNDKKDEEYLYNYFIGDSKLLVLSLIETIGNNEYEPLFQQAVKLPNSLRDYILGDTYLTKSLDNSCYLLEPEINTSSSNNPINFDESKQHIINIFGRDKQQNIKKAHELASNINFGLLFVDINKVIKSYKNIEKCISFFIRDALLSGSIIFFENFDSIYENDILYFEEKLIKKLEQLSWITFFSTKKRLNFTNSLPSQFKIHYYKQKFNSQNLLNDNNINTYAKLIRTSNKLQDIVLPSKQNEQLLEIMSHYKNKDLIFDQWNFKNYFQSKGITLLFSGSSGTGKTMAASILAKELKLELFKIDLSNMVSKYVGETEKNLSKLFNIAQEGDVILFFDEADAIFGKRSNIKESHDKYANIETSYLLQKIEEYDGIIILASNFKDNIDEAFIRRFRFIIEFPTPNAKQREEIWNKILSTEHLEKSIKFVTLAKQFKLSGANIRNIALYSAFNAASDNSIIKKKHIIKGIKTELEKTNIAINDEQFEEFLKS